MAKTPKALGALVFALPNIPEHALSASSPSRPRLMINELAS